MSLGFRGQAQNHDILKYVQTPTADGYETVRTILANEVSPSLAARPSHPPGAHPRAEPRSPCGKHVQVATRKIEFASLLDNNATVLINAGSRNRTGSTLDPDGLVSQVLADPGAGQVRGYRIERRVVRATGGDSLRVPPLACATP